MKKIIKRIKKWWNTPIVIARWKTEVKSEIVGDKIIVTRTTKFY